jgi:hypothetical protein
VPKSTMNTEARNVFDMKRNLSMGA